MTRIIALSLTYLLLLYGIAVGFQSLSNNYCSDWLTSCTDMDATPARAADEEAQPVAPNAPELG